MYQANQHVFARITLAATLALMTLASINHLFAVTPAEVDAAKLAAQQATVKVATSQHSRAA